MEQINTDKLINIGKFLSKEISLIEILDQLHQGKIECDELTVVILCMNWKFYKNDAYLKLHNIKDIIKTLIVHGAGFDKDARRFCWRISELKKNDLDEIENFEIKYKKFLDTTLTRKCLIFFRDKNINLEDTNIPNELKEKYLTIS